MGKFVKNTTDSKLEVTLGGVVYKWPPHVAIWFDDESMARWFRAKGEHPKSPADGRLETTYDFVLVDRLDEGEAPAEEVLVPPPEEFPPTPQDPVAPKQVHPGNPELKEIKARRELERWPKEQLIVWCKKHGLYTRGMDRGRMIDKLASAGFVPPVA
jgi:hypothetical protein